MSNKLRIINLISNRNQHSRDTSDLLRKKLENKGFLVSRGYDTRAELNICIGGDGRFLRAVHRNNFPKIPFVGVNTGHLGFFQEISPEKIDKFIDSYINGNYTIEEINLISANVSSKNKNYKLLGVNELVVKGIKSKVIHLEVYIDGNHLQSFSGDGIIISTPVGSTAYNFSSGGSIIYPTLTTMQMTPLSPINSQAYRSLPNSIITPGDTKINIKPEFKYKNSMLIVIDGREFRYDNVYDIELTISEKCIKRLIFNKNNYWNNLKSKFL